MGTIVSSLGLSAPVTFLNSSVLSFNGNLGFGGQESTLTVELVDDCQANPPQSFANGNADALIGTPQFFPTTNGGGMAFTFAGILTDYKVNESSSGKTYTATLSDPRRLLENVMIITDTYSGGMGEGAKNIYNVYRHFEPREVTGAVCGNFGLSEGSSGRGMPYYKVIAGLQEMNIIVYTPTGSALSVDLSNVTTYLPQYYRVNGPAISLLQLVTDIAEASGFDFYVYLDGGPGNWIVRFYFIDLRTQPTFNSVSWIVSNYANRSIDRSYGRELRIDKEKTMIMGEKVHYLVPVTEFIPFFGENQSCLPITATPSSGGCGFNVEVNTAPLVASLRYESFPVGNLTVTELDIRAALGSFQLWKERAQTASIPGTFNAAVRSFLASHGITSDPKQAFDSTADALNVSTNSLYRSTADIANNPNPSKAKVTVEAVNEDLQKIHNYVVSLGRTYYGKQYLCKLPQNICAAPLYGEIAEGSNCITSEMIYTAEPTNDGGWTDQSSVLGLSDPYLGFFKQEDGRVGPFALFNTSGDIPPGTST